MPVRIDRRIGNQVALLAGWSEGPGHPPSGGAAPATAGDHRLLVAARHTHSELLHEHPDPTPTPAQRRAVELIEDHAAEPLTVEDVATAVGVGVRSLQQGFHAHLGTTPTAYLRQVRLKRVREELLAAAPEAGISVTDVALRWGFTHLGRFAKAYRSTFGEPPSATLRRS